MHDVVQVGPAGLAPGEPAPAVVPLAGGAVLGGAGAAAAPAQGQHRAIAIVPHPGQRGAAADHLRGADADGRAVLDVAPRRVRRVVGGGGARFRGNGGWLGSTDGAGADVHDDLVHLGVIGTRHFPGQE